MAEDRLQQDPFSDIEAEVGVLERERKKQQKEREVDRRIGDLAEQTASFIMEYGEDYYLSELMMSYLEVALEMQNTVRALSATNMAMQCIFSTIDFLDEALGFYEELQNASLQKNYGFFARMKSRRRLKKVITNNKRRISLAIDNMVGQQRMAQNISESLKDAVDKMHGAMAKQKAKRAKKEAKGKVAPKGTTAFGESSRAGKLVEDIIKRRKGDAAEGDEAPSGNGGGSAPSKDDYSDIL